MPASFRTKVWSTCGRNLAREARRLAFERSVERERQRMKRREEELYVTRRQAFERCVERERQRRLEEEVYAVEIDYCYTNGC